MHLGEHSNSLLTMVSTWTGGRFSGLGGSVALRNSFQNSEASACTDLVPKGLFSRMMTAALLGLAPNWRQLNLGHPYDRLDSIMK